MADDEERLAPEQIDETIDALAARHQALPPEAPRPAEMQLVQALQAAYAEERHADAGSLADVWQRLATSYAASVSQQQQSSQQPQLSVASWRPQQ
jgi:hypothetical protein